MRIESLSVRHGFHVATFDFDPSWTVVHSETNNVGKTTLLRCLLYGMGEDVPGTSRLKFDELETRLDVVSDACERVRIIRSSRNRTQLLRQDGTASPFVLPFEISNLRHALYGVENPSVLENILGVWYVEQDHGWAMACEGTVIGRISFSAKKLVEGLCGTDFEDRRAECNRLDDELKRLKTIREALKYRESTEALQDAILLDGPADAAGSETLEEERACLVAKRATLSREIAEIENSLRDDARFGEYIENMKLAIKTPAGEVVRVTKESLCHYSDNARLLEARHLLVEEERKETNRRIKRIDALLEADPTLLRATGAQVRSGWLSDELGLDIDDRRLNAKIKDLSSKKKALNQDLERARNLAVSDKQELLLGITSDLASALGVSNAFRECGLYPTRDKLSSVSGAERMLLTLSYRLGYVKLLETVLGIRLPFVMDSVRAQELDKVRFAKVVGLLREKFVNHQVIVASRHLEGLESARSIEIGSGLMENAVLCDDMDAWACENFYNMK